jgi:hypothetical protein
VTHVLPGLTLFLGLGRAGYAPRQVQRLAAAITERFSRRLRAMSDSRGWQQCRFSGQSSVSVAVDGDINAANDSATDITKVI